MTHAPLLVNINLLTEFEVPNFIHSKDITGTPEFNNNSSGDEIANVNLYAVRPGSYRNSLK